MRSNRRKIPQRLADLNFGRPSEKEQFVKVQKIAKVTDGESSRLPAVTASLPSITELEKLVRESGFIRRASRKCSARGFVLATLQGVVQGASSLRQLSARLAVMEEQAMSRQAMSKRFSDRSSAFMKAVLGVQLRRRGQRVFEKLRAAPFTRVLVEDSTVISMAKSNAVHFPNNGNGKLLTAGCKVNIVTDILRGKVVSSELCPARLPDQKLAEDILPECRPGDLILRDKGYFSVRAILGIEARAAFWVSRLPVSVNAFDRKGTPLARWLKGTKRNQLDLRITMGTRTPHACLHASANKKPPRTAATAKPKHDAVASNPKPKVSCSMDGACLSPTSPPKTSTRTSSTTSTVCAGGSRSASAPSSNRADFISPFAIRRDDIKSRPWSSLPCCFMP
ncbi:MAG: transposase [Verrucomicrobiota bacterium]